MNESKESNHVFVCMEKLHSLNYILLNFCVTLMSRWKKCLNHFEKVAFHTLIDGKTRTSETSRSSKISFSHRWSKTFPLGKKMFVEKEFSRAYFHALRSLAPINYLLIATN